MRPENIQPTTLKNVESKQREIDDLLDQINVHTKKKLALEAKLSDLIGNNSDAENHDDQRLAAQVLTNPSNPLFKEILQEEAEIEGFTKKLKELS